MNNNYKYNYKDNGNQLLNFKSYKFQRKKVSKTKKNSRNPIKNNVNTKKKKVKKSNGTIHLGGRPKGNKINPDLKKLAINKQKKIEESLKNEIVNKKKLIEEFKRMTNTLDKVSENIEETSMNLFVSILNILNLSNNVLDSINIEETGSSKSLSKYIKSVRKTANIKVRYLKSIYNIVYPDDYGKLYTVGLMNKDKLYETSKKKESALHFYDVPSPVLSKRIFGRSKKFKNDVDDIQTGGFNIFNIKKYMTTKTVDTYTGSKLSHFSNNNNKLLHYNIAIYRERELQLLSMLKKVTNKIKIDDKIVKIEGQNINKDLSEQITKLNEELQKLKEEIESKKQGIETNYSNNIINILFSQYKITNIQRLLISPPFGIDEKLYKQSNLKLNKLKIDSINIKLNEIIYQKQKNTLEPNQENYIRALNNASDKIQQYYKEIIDKISNNFNDIFNLYGTNTQFEYHKNIEIFKNIDDNLFNLKTLFIYKDYDKPYIDMGQISILKLHQVDRTISRKRIGLTRKNKKDYFDEDETCFLKKSKSKKKSSEKKIPLNKNIIQRDDNEGLFNLLLQTPSFIDRFLILKMANQKEPKYEINENSSRDISKYISVEPNKIKNMYSIDLTQNNETSSDEVESKSKSKTKTQLKNTLEKLINSNINILNEDNQEPKSQFDDIFYYFNKEDEANNKPTDLNKISVKSLEPCKVKLFFPLSSYQSILKPANLLIAQYTEKFLNSKNKSKKNYNYFDAYYVKEKETLLLGTFRYIYDSIRDILYFLFSSDNCSLLNTYINDKNLDENNSKSLLLTGNNIYLNRLKLFKNFGFYKGLINNFFPIYAIISIYYDHTTVLLKRLSDLIFLTKQIQDIDFNINNQKIKKNIDKLKKKFKKSIKSSDDNLSNKTSLYTSKYKNLIKNLKLLNEKGNENDKKIIDFFTIEDLNQEINFKDNQKLIEDIKKNKVLNHSFGKDDREGVEDDNKFIKDNSNPPKYSISYDGDYKQYVKIIYKYFHDESTTNAELKDDITELKELKLHREKIKSNSLVNYLKKKITASNYNGKTKEELDTEIKNVLIDIFNKTIKEFQEYINDGELLDNILKNGLEILNEEKPRTTGGGDLTIVQSATDSFTNEGDDKKKNEKANEKIIELLFKPNDPNQGKLIKIIEEYDDKIKLNLDDYLSFYSYHKDLINEEIKSTLNLNKELSQNLFPKRGEITATSSQEKLLIKFENDNEKPNYEFLKNNLVKSIKKVFNKEVDDSLGSLNNDDISKNADKLNPILIYSLLIYYKKSKSQNEELNTEEFIKKIKKNSNKFKEIKEIIRKKYYTNNSDILKEYDNTDDKIENLVPLNFIEKLIINDTKDIYEKFFKEFEIIFSNIITLENLLIKILNTISNFKKSYIPIIKEKKIKKNDKIIIGRLVVYIIYKNHKEKGIKLLEKIIEKDEFKSNDIKKGIEEHIKNPTQAQDVKQNNYIIKFCRKMIDSLKDIINKLLNDKEKELEDTDIDYNNQNEESKLGILIEQTIAEGKNISSEEMKYLKELTNIFYNGNCHILNKNKFRNIDQKKIENILKKSNFIPIYEVNNQEYYTPFNENYFENLKLELNNMYLKTGETENKSEISTLQNKIDEIKNLNGEILKYKIKINENYPEKTYFNQNINYIEDLSEYSDEDTIKYTPIDIIKYTDITKILLENKKIAIFNNKNNEKNIVKYLPKNINFNNINNVIEGSSTKVKDKFIDLYDKVKEYNKLLYKYAHITYLHSEYKKLSKENNYEFIYPNQLYYLKNMYANKDKYKSLFYDDLPPNNQDVESDYHSRHYKYFYNSEIDSSKKNEIFIKTIQGNNETLSTLFKKTIIKKMNRYIEKSNNNKKDDKVNNEIKKKKEEMKRIVKKFEGDFENSLININEMIKQYCFLIKKEEIKQIEYDDSKNTTLNKVKVKKLDFDNENENNTNNSNNNEDTS